MIYLEAMMNKVHRGYMKLTPWGWQVAYGQSKFTKIILMDVDDCKDFKFEDRGWIFFKIITKNGKQRAKFERKDN